MLEHVPIELRFMVPAARQWGIYGNIVKYDVTLRRHVYPAERLSSTDIEELKAVFHRYRLEQSAGVFQQWYRAVSELEDEGIRSLSWHMRGVLQLFLQLGEMGIDPFPAFQENDFIEAVSG